MGGRKIDLKLNLFLFIWVFYLLVCLCAVCIQCPQRLEEDVGSSGTGVIDIC